MSQLLPIAFPKNIENFSLGDLTSLINMYILTGNVVALDIFYKQLNQYPINNFSNRNQYYTDILNFNNN